MRWLRRIFFTLVALALIQVIYYYPQMPEVMASHWDGLGAANAWAGKDGFFGLYLVLVLMLVIIFEYVPRWSQSRSNFGMKLPHRDYWLAPERVQQTKDYFRRQMRAMGIAHLLLAIYTIQLAVMANFDPEPRLHSSIGWALLLYFVYLGVWLVRFYLRFRKP